ncbi:hypothetical protein [Brevibacillus brevis]|uniref:hypothetical protein n=1 Tax=Brevibacillus brevis TaxID=1393 RepID=UPI001643F0B3|nr:hypothetical protein [Brevibacillus brevis]
MLFISSVKAMRSERLPRNYYGDALKHKQIMVDNKVTVADMVPGLKLTLKGVPIRRG